MILGFLVFFFLFRFCSVFSAFRKVCLMLLVLFYAILLPWAQSFFGLFGFSLGFLGFSLGQNRLPSVAFGE